ncbi:hypothetical protein PYK79_41410 [Streptomyces sp. ID05-04B]|uniref:hypothetical protein n=1 Tax=Streptomyces sp. ID05-04B TaxID=3028661 RepID=UPI0029C4197E|nr:hypothetical protein [Streptomyces sp. ID05-04B]MDX5568463.1 hypothetical protein [Streptomyces sp. ID05-04B]
MTRWYPREHTKHGGFHPPLTALNRIGEPSSAMRRQEERIHDKRILADYVQLKPGVLVVYDRQPWRVIETAERPLDLWDDEYEKRFAEAVAAWERWGRGDRPEKATWSSRPMVVVLAPDGKPHEKPTHLIGPYHFSWQVLPEHYAICSACGELPPCRHELAEREADQQAARADVLMDIPPGHCLGCGEYVTTRQQAARFPGPNLWRPDMPDHSAVFHARQECSGEVERYRQQWEARGNTSPQPSLFPDEETP